MYVLTQHTSTAIVRAYRVDEDQNIWVELIHGTKIALSPDEAQKLVVGLQRELAAVEAEKRGVAA